MAYNSATFENHLVWNDTDIRDSLGFKRSENKNRATRAKQAWKESLGKLMY